jgi:hypothetical protein
MESYHHGSQYSASFVFVVSLDSPLSGGVTNNVVPGDLGRFRPEADLAMLYRGGYSSHD